MSPASEPETGLLGGRPLLVVFFGAWLIAGLLGIWIDQADLTFRCLRPNSDYGDVGWSWWPPVTTCDWGDGPERDPARAFWLVVYGIALAPPLLFLATYFGQRSLRSPSPAGYRSEQ